MVEDKYRLSRHFMATEFRCRCGKCELSNPDEILVRINPILIDKLEMVREFIQVPMMITSGARCTEKQISIYKQRYGEYWADYTRWDSKHLVNKSGKFEACDIICKYNLWDVAMISARIGFNGIIWYQKQTLESLVDDCLHIDVAERLFFDRRIRPRR